MLMMALSSKKLANALYFFNNDYQDNRNEYD